MCRFYSIFNEWYAAQTSKKIRAVNELKASQGKRVSAAVPYGYKKIKDDKTQQALAEFVKCYGAVFYAILEKKKGFFQQEKVKNLKSDIEFCKKRIAEIDKLFARSYEDNVLGRLDDNRYTRLAADYNKEQTELIEKLAEYEKELVGTEQKTVDAKMLFQGLMEFLEVKKLTPEIVNKLIQRIEVHNPKKKHAHNSVKIDITFTAIGLFEIPKEQELLEMAQQMKKSKQGFKSLSA